MSEFNSLGGYQINHSGNSSNNYNNYNKGPSNNYDDEGVVGVGTWLGVLVVTAIPIINIIVMLFLAFGSSNANLKNYGKASLILIVIVMFLSVLLGGCSI